MDNVLISGKETTENFLDIKEKCKKIGTYFSEDRFYTLLNSYIDDALRKYSLFLYLITIFLFRSNNFKHATTSFKAKPKWVTLIDILCWICLIVFIVSLISGISYPLIEGISGAIKGNWTGFIDAFNNSLNSPGTITLFVVSLISFIIAITYIYVLRKIVVFNKKLSLKDFVVQKVSFINRFENLLKINEDLKKANKKIKKINKKINKKNSKIKPDEFYLIQNVEMLSQNDLWLLFQIINILYKLFPNSGFVFELSNIESSNLEKIKTICNYDFKHIKITHI
ncbi:hypothetical protein [Mycoplasmoides pirum]|uniref:hypothetical protein n=1 Tax=Mycoplasmoides pirum TaxID=2122 RepID=UPI000560C3E0|nr:hypothetical protein [Mycoplasmoides pirum]